MVQTEQNGQNRTQRWFKHNTKMVQTEHKNGPNTTQKWSKQNTKMVQTEHKDDQNTTQTIQIEHFQNQVWKSEFF